MNEKAKKIFNSFIILAIIVAGVALIIFLSLPKPKPKDAYNYSVSLATNNELSSLEKAQGELVSLMQSKLDETDFNNDIYNKLRISMNILHNIKIINEFNSSRLIYCSNNKIYNSNTKKMKSVLKNIESDLEISEKYIAEELTSFLHSSTKPLNIANSYCMAITNLTKNILINFNNFNKLATQIISNLKNDLRINIFTKQLLKTTNMWNTVNLESLKKDVDMEQLYNNSSKSISFANFFKANFNTYYQNQKNLDEIAKILDVDNLNEILKVIGTNKENEYKNSIPTPEILAKTTIVIETIKEL